MYLQDYCPTLTLLLLSSLLSLTFASSLPSFRPPSIPLLTSDPFMQLHLNGDDPFSDISRFWDRREQELLSLVQVNGENWRVLGDCRSFERRSIDCPSKLDMEKVEVLPTKTVFTMKSPEFDVTLTFLSPLFTDDLLLLSRPIHYISIKVSNTDDTDVKVFLSLSSQFTVNNESEHVTWSSTSTGVKLGTQEQDILGQNGDKSNINWGYLHLSSTSPSLTDFWAGSITDSLTSFLSNGSLPTSPDTNMPRPSNSNLPGLTSLQTLTNGRATFLVGYDDVSSIKYFGNEFMAYWTGEYESIEDALIEAGGEFEELLSRSCSFDSDLINKFVDSGGQEYAALASLAYRQTLSATKLVLNNDSKPWMFIKEISTNGDMNTVDVLFPSSPFFLYFNPDLLKFMIEPVLSYASNETIIEYNSPYSPHQLGVYPFGDSKTEDQEQMPLENTSNMFIMLLSILQRNDDTVWFEERFDMLKTWADDLLSSLPFPETQLSTDDFMGAYPNNTNLAAKGCIGLEAFSVVCEMLDGDDCEVYKEKAESFADTWVEESYTNQPSPHYKMAFGQANHTYSLKYNLVWQKILNLDGPFKNWKDIAKDEVEFYKGKGLKYGVPLESKVDGTRPIFRTFTKLDWLCWVAIMSEDQNDWSTLFTEPAFKMANETISRYPLTDLWETITGVSFDGILNFFVARPVVGALYAKMLV